MGILITTSSGLQIIITGVTLTQFTLDVSNAILGIGPQIKSYTEEAMGTISLNLLDVTYFRQF